METRRTNVCIIGSIKQIDEIKKLASEFEESGYFVVRHEDPMNSQGKTHQYLARKSFDRIRWADIVVVVPKPNGEFGESTSYEAEYASRIGKLIFVCHDDILKNLYKVIGGSEV